jgi:ribulose-phosphate 3-epimerase
MPRETLAAWPPSRLLVAPSILSADFSRMGEAVAACVAGQADLIHIDVMDGHFVPNLAIGPDLVKAIRPLTTLPFDVHLMLTQPSRYWELFRRAGADHITIHVEAPDDLAGTLKAIRAAGCGTGLALKPGTPAASIAPYLELLDLILIMTVEPGFSGQAFRRDVLPKIAELRQMVRQSGRPIHLEMDGGINAETGAECVAQGANILAAASSVFGARDGVSAAMQRLRAIAPPA